MYLQRLSLTNFRNFLEFEQDYARENVLIIGPNASGKTNLLEAIYFLSHGQSFRTHLNQELITWNKEFSRLEGEILSDDDQHFNLEVIIQKTQTKLLINGKAKLISSNLIRFPVVLFSPYDLFLLRDIPERRRHLLDQAASCLDSNFPKIKKQYDKILRNRNHLLSQGRVDFEQFSFWDQNLTQAASFILKRRAQAIQKINSFLSTLGKKMVYVPSPRVLRERFFDLVSASEGQISEVFYDKLTALSVREKELGFTLIGPQRDDWEIFDSKDVNLGKFGSQAEQRLTVLDLKFAYFDLLREKSGETPILLLDDVFSELDKSSRNSLRRIFGRQQSIVTSTERELSQTYDLTWQEIFLKPVERKS